MPKFSDIPQFTRSSPYQVNVSLRYLLSTLEDYDSDNLQLNPDFQRGHVWTEEQQVKYVEFLLRGGQSARDVYFNHPGWLKSFKGEFVCVDGLQRITACTRFLKDEIKVFGHYYSEYEDKSLLNSISLVFHINDLKTKAEVLKWYLEMNSGGTVHSQEELDRVAKMLEQESK